MTKTELLNKTARSEDERLLLARTLDRLELARTRSIPAHTGFLSPQERTAVEALLNACGHPRHLFFGGFPQAERTVCFFLPDWQEEENVLEGEDCPVRALRASFTGGGLTHRDFLGAILGLGLDREKVGDLLVGQGVCDILVFREIAPYLRQNLTEAGRAKLKVAEIDLSEIAPPEKQVKVIHDTVSSPRLDAVMAAGFAIGRSKAAGLISTGKVELNHRPCVKPDRTVNEGDTLTCRGLGKCVLKEVNGLSKKGRTILVLERYL